MSSISSGFGYHTAQSMKNNTPWHAVDEEEDFHSYIFHNCINSIGYIPILGIVTGILRIIAAVLRSDWSDGARATQGIRGLFEISGCGFLMLIPDLIVSIGRHLCSNTAEQLS